VIAWLITAGCETGGGIVHHHRASVWYGGAVGYLHRRVSARSGGNWSRATTGVVYGPVVMTETTTLVGRTIRRRWTRYQRWSRLWSGFDIGTSTVDRIWSDDIDGGINDSLVYYAALKSVHHRRTCVWYGGVVLSTTTVVAFFWQCSHYYHRRLISYHQWFGQVVTDTTFFRINCNNNINTILIKPDPRRIHIHNVITYTSLPGHSSIKQIHPPKRNQHYKTKNISTFITYGNGLHRDLQLGP
jgi:hypothetical protein